MKIALATFFAFALCLLGLAPTASAANYTCNGNHCWKITKKSASFSVGYSDGLYNNTGGTAPLTCETSTEVKKSYSISATAKAEASGIFVTASASVTGGLQKSSSSGLKVKVGPVQVPAWTSERCQRGILVYNFTFSYCLGSSQGLSCHPAYVHAPQGPSWRLTRTKISH